MINFLTKPTRLWLAFELSILFIVLPILVAGHPTPISVPLSLWLVTAYTAVILTLMPDFSWHEAWSGRGWAPRDMWTVSLRFVLSMLGVFLLTHLIAPQRLLSLPQKKPLFWLAIMIVYPLLSALPQELIFRTFFFRRYRGFFPQNWVMLTASAAAFSFVHIVFHNPIAPVLTFICGLFLATSYQVHLSLKRVAIEHAFYGDMVFTLGLGYYFLVGFHS